MVFHALKFLPFAFSLAALASVHPFETPDHTRNAFGNPFPKLNPAERDEFFAGKSFFRQSWVQPGSRTQDPVGLGPTFNAVSCSACHSRDGRGIGAEREGFAHVSLLFRLAGAEVQYGAQLNPFAVENVTGEAHPYIKLEISDFAFPDGEVFSLRRPAFELINWMFSAPAPATRVSARVANQMIGLGLLEEIPATEIEMRADPEDKNGDGISGRASQVLNLGTGSMVLGRFGWKAEQPTVEQQNAAAFNGDMGLTSALFPNENCPVPQLACQAAPKGASPEVSDLILERVSHYMRSIAVPVRRDLPNGNGQKTFSRIGCASCHHPSYSVHGVQVFPYTDILLHDMGDGLNDQTISGTSLPTEWRTPPLWGIGLFPTVNGHQNLMHDGRARGVQEAILWHEGEGKFAKKAYMNLSKTARQELIEFVNSL